MSLVPRMIFFKNRGEKTCDYPDPVGLEEPRRQASKMKKVDQKMYRRKIVGTQTETETGTEG